MHRQIAVFRNDGHEKAKVVHEPGRFGLNIDVKLVINMVVFRKVGVARFFSLGGPCRGSS
jgi:hypothetical protein